MDKIGELGAAVGRAARFDYSGLVHGIDISHHQGVIDFNKVKAGGIIHPGVKPPADFKGLPVEYAFVKITEGVSGRDKRAGFNAGELYRVGIPWGPYHFCTLNRKDEVADATEEAQYVAKRLQDLPPYQMPLALDVELEDKVVKLTPEETENWIRAFFSEITRLGHPDFVLYSYSPFLRKHLPQQHSLGQVRLWAARYGGKFPDPVQGWGQKFWAHQYSATGKVAGINTDVDLNKILK